MEKGEKELVILGLLESSKYSTDTTTHGKKRKKQWHRYTYQGEEVCAGGFRLLYNIGSKQLKNLKKHLEENGLVPRTHGNVGRKPKHALSYDTVSAVVQFLKTYTERFGIPQPAPTRGRAGAPPTYLPASSTVKSIHKCYVTSLEESGIRAVGYHTFRSVWLDCLPNIQIMTPRTDVCSRCENFRRRIQEARTEPEKSAACDEFKQHLDATQAERDYYRQATLQARAELDACTTIQQQLSQPCSRDLHHPHYTFDFAQNVALPQSARQEGPLYFKAPRKVQIFGVNNEAVPQQVNYLIDESDTIGQDGKSSHGPNAVASMLHHFFSFYGLHEKGCLLHCDNCAGQNKNRTIVAYFCWRVIMGLHDRIELSFMLTGHTRCLVDGCFGLLKQKFRRSDCYTMGQLVAVVNESASCNKAQLIPGSGLEWRAWDTFLAQHFKPVKGIRKVQHMVFDAAKPGIVSVKASLEDTYSDVEVLTTSKDALVAAGMPPVLQAPGLSEQRQQYLYNQIRPHVPDQFQDELCPKPAVHVSASAATSASPVEE
eukprot:scpid44506/ scgid15886/ 